MAGTSLPLPTSKVRATLRRALNQHESCAQSGYSCVLVFPRRRRTWSCRSAADVIEGYVDRGVES